VLSGREVSATGCSLVQRSPFERGISECDREASTMMMPWHTRGCRPAKKREKTNEKAASFTD
jgi:hypothetical protein